MNGYELTDKLRKTRRRHRLLAPTQALYYELVAICNEEQWPDEFKCSNGELCAALVMDEKTLIKHRHTLIQCGLLSYKSGQSKHKVGIYSFATTGNIPANPPANVPAQPPDLIKTVNKKETKTKRLERTRGSENPVFNFPKEKKQKSEKPKKNFVPPELIEVEIFFSERGQNPQAAKLAFEFYSSADWHDSQGNPVFNWQQKMISWISREQKTNGNGTHQQASKQSIVRKSAGAEQLLTSLKNDLASIERSGS